MTNAQALKILRKFLKEETNPDYRRHIEYLIAQRKKAK